MHTKGARWRTGSLASLPRADCQAAIWRLRVLMACSPVSCNRHCASASESLWELTRSSSELRRELRSCSTAAIRFLMKAVASSAISC